jgi:hypothetical protein
MTDSAPNLPPIKHCPFCGRLPCILYETGHLSIYCPNEDCVAPETGGCPTDVSVRRWNTRTTPTETQDV